MTSDQMRLPRLRPTAPAWASLLPGSSAACCAADCALTVAPLSVPESGETRVFGSCSAQIGLMWVSGMA